MPTQKQKLILFYWLPVFIWCAIIYHFSSIPDLKSDFPNEWDFVLRKIAHITEYAVLTLLFFRAASQDMGRRRALFYAALFTFVFAFTDEYHQTFVMGRSGNLRDALIDSLGIFLSLFLIDKRRLDGSIINKNKKSKF